MAEGICPSAHDHFGMCSGSQVSHFGSQATLAPRLCLKGNIGMCEWWQKRRYCTLQNCMSSPFYNTVCFQNVVLQCKHKAELYWKAYLFYFQNRPTSTPIPDTYPFKLEGQEYGQSLLDEYRCHCPQTLLPGMSWLVHAHARIGQSKLTLWCSPYGDRNSSRFSKDFTRAIVPAVPISRMACCVCVHAASSNICCRITAAATEDEQTKSSTTHTTATTTPTEATTTQTWTRATTTTQRTAEQRTYWRAAALPECVWSHYSATSQVRTECAVAAYPSSLSARNERKQQQLRQYHHCWLQ